MILIISSPDDAHLPFVTKHLKEAFVVIDPGTILAGKSLTYEVEKDQFTVRYDGKRLKDVSGVWYRKPRDVQTDLDFKKVEERYSGYAQSALKSHFEQLYTAFSDAAWISDIYAIRRANNKTLQLVTAQKLGFRIPETVFTSDAKIAGGFVKRQAETIVKSLASQWPQPDLKKQQQHVFFSARVNPETSINFEGLNLAPAIFQESIPFAFDIRVAVVGAQAFATKITLRSGNVPPTVRGWRIGHAKGMGKLNFESYELPDEISEKCIALTRKLGLRFGAIDLVQDKEGGSWFLEINPNGQWAFVDETTTDNIGRAIAKLLGHSGKILASNSAVMN